MDEGVGLGWYTVEWSMDPDLLEDVQRIDRVFSESAYVYTPDEGKWYIRVTAFDALGNEGGSTVVETTMDTMWPSEPVLEPLPEVHGETILTVDWTPSNDESSGVYHRLYWQEHNFEGMVRYMDVTYRPYRITGLTDGVRYWIWMTAFDAAGNSRSSDKYRVDIDATPPPPRTLLPVPEYTDMNEVQLMWTGRGDPGGGSLEDRVHWTYSLKPGEEILNFYPGGQSEWLNVPLYNVTELEDGRTYKFWILTRDLAGHVSERSNEVMMTVDMTPPVVNIASPEDHSILSGTVIIEGTFEEANPVTFWVQYQPQGGIRWTNLTGPTPVPGSGEFRLTWDTRLETHVRYILRVNVTDGAGHHGGDQVEVTVGNARLSLAPADITFSDPSPENGDKVTVYVSLRAYGDAVAYDVTVELFDGGKLVDSYIKVTLGPHAVYVFPFKIVVDGTHEFTARASSDLYDTGEMDGGRTLEAEGDGGSISVSSPVAWVGMLAIVLAVIAIALNLVDRLRKPTTEEKGNENVQVEVDDDWVGSKEEGT